MKAEPLLPLATLVPAEGGLLARAAELFAPAGYNLRVVLLGCGALGIAAGVVGTFALLRRRSLTADALAHATLPGVVLGFLAAGALGFDPRGSLGLLLGAALTAALAAWTIQAIRDRSRLPEDAAIGIVLSVFFGAGVVLLSWVQREAAGEAGGLNHLIYGRTATLRAGDVLLMTGLAAVASAAALLLRKEFALAAFDAAFARTSGWPVRLIDTLLMVLVVVVTVAGLQAVGLLMIVALLVIPPVSARFWTERLSTMMLLAALIGLGSGLLGGLLSAAYPDTPAGAVIVLSAGSSFVLSFLFAPSRGLLARALRRIRLRLRIEGDHLLERAFERREDEPNSLALPATEWRALAEERRWSLLTRTLLAGRLRRAGHLVGHGAALAPTSAGLARGAQVRRNHLLWEQYLESYADIAREQVDWFVDRVEHVLSPGLVRELEATLRARGLDTPLGTTTPGGASA